MDGGYKNVIQLPERGFQKARKWLGSSAESGI